MALKFMQRATETQRQTYGGARFVGRAWGRQKC